MKSKNTPGPQPATRAVRAGLVSDAVSGAVVPPIFLSSTYAFHGYGEKRPYDYSRTANPTRDLLGKALAELEEGAGAVITASGIGAITLVGHLFNVGARIVAPHDCYGGSHRLFCEWQRRGEFQVQFVDFADAAPDAALDQQLRRRSKWRDLRGGSGRNGLPDHGYTRVATAASGGEEVTRSVILTSREARRKDLRRRDASLRSA